MRAFRLSVLAVFAAVAVIAGACAPSHGGRSGRLCRAGDSKCRGEGDSYSGSAA